MRDEVPLEVYRPYHQMDFVLGMYRLCAHRAPAGAGIFEHAPRGERPGSESSGVSDENGRNQMDESLITERLVATLSTGFGMLATLLAAIGLYGVMAYIVAQRTREIGVRMALGAAAGDVVWLVMKDVFLLTAIGIAIGLPAAWGLTRMVRSQLYGIQPNDALTIAWATIGIALVALLAGYVPAQRAAHVDPMRALRWE